MKTIGGVALAVVILLAMVTIHEFGHYIAGRLLGFKITEFAVGFGPALFKKRSKKTGVLFALRLVPLGGYCAFDGEDEDLSKKEDEDNEEDEPFEEMTAQKEGNSENEGGMSETNETPSVTESEETEDKNEDKKKEDDYPEPQGARFNDQPPWKRIIVLIAGATMNYLLALFLIILMFACVGRPVYTVAESDKFQPAAGQTFEGLQAGDTILEIDGKTLYMLTDWQDALNGKKKGDVVDVLVIRDGKKQTIPVSLYADANVKNMSDSNVIFYSLGLVVHEEVDGEKQLVRYLELHSQTVRDGFFPTIGHSFMYSFKLGGSVLRSLGELITGKIGIKAMGGPVTTISVTAEAATNGFASFLNIAALIGVNLAVFNLLPVPALDGCKVIFCIIEWIRKKPINRKVETIINLVGIIFLLGFAVLVDLLHFIL
ncbi:MAG: site-2 protease family protein [Clostridia bacterium]|nr:site-2 protease family protein [Clostridia bacterium]